MGILTLGDDLYPNKSYFFGSDPKWMESSGLRWIPLLLQETKEQTEIKLELIDAVLFTGGNENFRTVYGHF